MVVVQSAGPPHVQILSAAYTQRSGSGCWLSMQDNNNDNKKKKNKKQNNIKRKTIIMLTITGVFRAGSHITRRSGDPQKTMDPGSEDSTSQRHFEAETSQSTLHLDLSLSAYDI